MSAIFRGNIYIDGSRAPANSASWNAGDYERAVLRVLERMEQTTVGRVVLGHITRKVIIRPSPDMAVQWAAASSESDPGAFRAGEPLRYTSDVPGTSRDERGTVWMQNGRPVVGTGAGRDVVPVEYIPGQWPQRPAPADGMALFTGESVLLHELVHAVHYMHGVMAQHTMFRFHDVDEFRAVAVTNMFLSEQHYPLRANQDEHAHAPVMGWNGWREGYRIGEVGSVDRMRVIEEGGQIEAYANDLPSFAYNLASIPRSTCAYNPFRAREEGRWDEIPLAPSSWCAGSCRSVR